MGSKKSQLVIPFAMSAMVLFGSDPAKWARQCPHRFNVGKPLDSQRAAGWGACSASKTRTAS